jgi:hypothetical protein
MVAAQSIWTIRTSPDGSLMVAMAPSLATSWAEVPALRHIWPPLPGWSSMLWMVVPAGMFRRGRALPGRMSAAGPEETVSPTFRPWGARM